MKILLCGANGFIGRHLAQALQKSGHHVIFGVKKLTAKPSNDRQEICINYAQDSTVKIWEKRLQELGTIDIVINAVGILNESKNAPFNAIHQNTPIALFDAAQRCSIKGIIQISALGARDEEISKKTLTPYMQTKRNADQFLIENISQTNCRYLILRPSFVVGIDGDGSKLFRLLASFPIITLPGQGQQQMQPIHVDDICQSVLNWIQTIGNNTATNQLIKAVGPVPMSYREMLMTFRREMKKGKPIFIPIPMPLMRLSASLASLLPQKVLSPETLHMLEQDNTADGDAFYAQLGRKPKGSEAWLINTT